MAGKVLDPDRMELVPTGKYRVEYQDDSMDRGITVTMDEDHVKAFLIRLTRAIDRLEFVTVKIGAVMEYPEEK